MDRIVEDALRKQKAQLESLRQINLRLSTELDLQNLLQAITQSAVELLGGSGGGFYLHRPDLDLLECAVAVGSDLLPLGTMVRRGEGLPGQAWQADEPFILEDYRQWAGQHGPADAQSWGGVVAVPICYGRKTEEGQFFGVLEVMVKKPRSFSREDAELLCLFSDHAAASLRNASLYELAQREIAEGRQAQEQLRRERDLVSRIMETSPMLQAEKALRESEARYRRVVETSPVAIVLVEPKGKILACNQQAATLHNFESREAMTGTNILDLFPPEELGRARKSLHKAWTEGSVKALDCVLLRKDGSRFPAELSASALYDEEGRPQAIVGMARDITERLQSQAALQESVEALERRNRVLEILNKLSEVAWSTSELDLLLNTVVQVAVQAIDATSGYICDWQEPAGTTTCLAEYHAPEAGEAERTSDLGVECHTAEGFGGRGDWLYSSEAYHVVQAIDPQLSARERVFMARLGVKSVLNVPLKIRGKPSGYIELWESRQVRSFAPEEVELVLSLARQLSIAMENARLYEQTQRELVERRQAQERLQASLEEKEVLLKEIHHRVKNNLQVISSLLDMQSLSIQSPEAIEALEDSGHRVRTMAFVHERLYQSEDVASVDVREYLESLAGYLLAAYEGSTERVHLNLQVEDVCLDLDTAIASGLIVNELVSNALKHAFPPGWEGDREIGVELGAADEGRFELQVRDNGVGFPAGLDTVDTQSLGLRLVNMLTQQLHGSLELLRSAGTTFRITFPGTARAPGEKAGRE